MNKTKSNSPRPFGRIRTIFVIAFGSVLGIPLGLATYTFIYGKGYSYLSSDPRACINCHIMQDQYRSWSRSSHHAVAVCNDCHTPGNILGKYQAKAVNGFWHSWAFTTGRFVEPIHIKPQNLRAAERSCRECHQSFLQASGIPEMHSKGMSCIRCHSSVGHAP